MLKTDTDKPQVINKHEFIRLLYSSTQIPDSLLNEVKRLIQQQSSIELQSKTPNLLTLLNDSESASPNKLPENLTNLISLFDRLFDYIQTEEHLHPKIMSLIGHLRVHFFYLVLTDSSLLTDNNHPVRLFFNDMVKVGLLWSEDDPKTGLIEEQLSQTVSQILRADELHDIETLIYRSAKQFNQFSAGLLKRTEIFEKRIKESELAKAKTESARLWAKERIAQITAKKNTPNFILTTFNQAWEHVLYLSRIKGLEDEQEETQLTLKQLIVSLQPIKKDAELQKFVELKPFLLKKIIKGLENTPLSMNETEHLLSRLNGYYEQILQLAQEFLNDSSNEEIIRLKPTSQLDLGIIQSKLDNSQQAVIAVEDMNMAEWVEFCFDNIPKTSHNLKVNKNTEKNVQLKTLEPGKWFELTINGEVSRGKFACYITQNDKYLFVNGMGSKIAEFNSNSLENAFNNKEIKRLETTSTFDRAYDQLASEVVESHLKQQQERHRVAQEKAAAEERELVDKKIKDKLKQKEQQKVAEEEAQLAARQAQLEKHKSEQQIQNITHLPIGSWVEIHSDNEILKCRLAAKITSTGKYIFVDRAGIKVKQCFEKELCEMYDTGLIKLKLKHDVFDSALASVITNIRGVKPVNK
jgi:hypothetical protein